MCGVSKGDEQDTYAGAHEGRGEAAQGHESDPDGGPGTDGPHRGEAGEGKREHGGREIGHRSRVSHVEIRLTTSTSRLPDDSSTRHHPDGPQPPRYQCHRHPGQHDRK